MYGNINCMGLKIFNIGPNNNRDQVVNGGYVKDNSKKKNQVLTWIIKKIINLKNPENDTVAVNKQYIDNKLSIIHESNKNIDLKEQYNVINSKQQSFTDLTSHYDNLVHKFPMQTTLNMNNNKIYNLSNDTNIDGVVNKGYIDQADTNIKNEIQQLKNDVNNEFIQTQSNIDLKDDKSDVNDNIKMSILK